MEIHKAVSYVLSTVALIVSLGSGFIVYHAVFATVDSVVQAEARAKLSDAAIIFHIESRNQSLTNLYNKKLDRGDEVVAQLDRLEYDRGGIKALKHAVMGEE